jgi:hypothetical protein
MEGVVECHGCKRCVCPTCNVNASIGNEKVIRMCCIECYGHERCFPTDTIELTEHVSLGDKLEALASIGTQMRQTDSIDDIDDNYEALIINKQAVYNGQNLLNRVKYPTENSSYLKKEIEKICTFDICKGGRFFSSNDLNIEQKIELTKLLADLVDVPKANRNECTTYHVIPTLIRLFAEGCRVYCGFRLLKRAIRHAMDPHAHDISLCKAHVIKYNNKTGLVISHKVKASMKQVTYNTSVAFTSDALIATSCTCKAGSAGFEKQYVFMSYLYLFRYVN